VLKILAEDSNRDSKKLKPVDSEPISPAETDVNQLPIILSDALASFFGTGEKEMPSSEAVKRVWDHIKSNNLEVSDYYQTFVYYIVLIISFEFVVL
jgi:chromatin remodeling complex protein RSC6